MGETVIKEFGSTSTRSSNSQLYEAKKKTLIVEQNHNVHSNSIHIYLQ